MTTYLEKISVLLIYFGKIFTSINYKLLYKNSPHTFKRIIATWDFFSGKINSQPPTYVLIEPTNICNLKCVMCPNQSQTREKGNLSFENFKKIVDSLDSAVENISLSFMGETLLNPDLNKMIAYAKSEGFGISLSTNISFLHKEKSEEIASSGLDVLILSLDSEKPETYEAIRKGSNFVSVAKNVKDFLEINQNRVFTIVQKIHFQQNKNSTWDYVREMRKLGADLVRLKPYRDLATDRSNLRVDKVDKKKLSKIKCPYLWKISVYTWQGDMVPCAVDFDAKIKVGNAYQSTHRELWNNEILQNMRTKHIEGKKEDINLCRGCSAIDFNMSSMFLSDLVDSTNQVRIISIIQTIKILLQNFRS